MSYIEKHWILLNSPDNVDLDWLSRLGISFTVDRPTNRFAYMTMGNIRGYFSGDLSVKITTVKEEEETFLKLRFGDNLCLTTTFSFDDDVY